MVTNAVSRCDQILSGALWGPSNAYRRLDSGHRRIVRSGELLHHQDKSRFIEAFGFTPFRVRNTQY
jgi:hypothetical protein